jgi:hypothetical protein
MRASSAMREAKVLDRRAAWETADNHASASNDAIDGTVT